MTARGVSIAMVAAWLASSVHEAHVQPQPLHRYEASRMSMACEYAIDAYGRDADALPRIVNDAFDEVDRIDRLMSHYKANSPCHASTARPRSIRSQSNRSCSTSSSTRCDITETPPARSTSPSVL
jgi:hypothetical protein